MNVAGELLAKEKKALVLDQEIFGAGWREQQGFYQADCIFFLRNMVLTEKFQPG